MSMNDTPSSERLPIGFFGRRNAGKSSLVNAVTGQQLSVVSEVKGTTPDPIQKTMELLQMANICGMDDIQSLFKETIASSWRMAWRQSWMTS